MNVRVAIFALALLPLAGSGGKAFAHHSFSLFDMDKEVTYKGIVAEYKWLNPHVHITVDIKAGPGVDGATIGTWDVEGGSMTIMGRQGWTRATFKKGDPITLVGHPMKDGSKGVSLFYVILPDGKRLYHDIARPKGESATGAVVKQRKLTKAITEREFDNGYWYATELKAFALKLGVPSANKLRKDELEQAVRHYIRTGEAKKLVTRSVSKSGTRDLDKGLRLDLPVAHYTSNRETKDFIVREAAKIEPGFTRVSGTRYLLNRWREAQISSGRRITYRDLVHQAIRLNKTKQGPLRADGYYITFVSDFMAANKGSSHAAAVKAWKEIKTLDAPKTYAAWARARRR